MTLIYLVLGFVALVVLSPYIFALIVVVLSLLTSVAISIISLFK